MKDVATKLPTARVFNSTAFLILIIGVVVLGGAIFGLHHVQVRRSAGKLLTQAENAEQDGRMEDALRNYSNYVGLRPRDSEAKARLGKVLLKVAKTATERKNAAHMLRDYAQLNDNKIEELRTAAEIYTELGMFEEARTHFTTIGSKDPSDAKAEFYLGLCEVNLLHYDVADVHFQKSIKNDPTFLKPYVYRAVLLQQKLKKVAAADSLMLEMIEKNKESGAAYLERAKYYQLSFDLTNNPKYKDSAAADIAQAAKLEANLTELPLVQAKQYNLSQDYSNSEKVLRVALAKSPNDYPIVSMLARILTQTGKSEDAVKVIQSAYLLSPLDKDMGWLLADTMIQAGQTKEAGELIQRLRSENLPEASLRFLEGTLALREGKWDVARSSLEQAASRLEQLPEIGARAYLALGLCHERFDALEPALAAYRKAETLNPSWSMAFIKAANVLTTMGRYEEASKEYLAMSGPKAEGVTLIALAGLKISETLQQPETRRNWKIAEALVNDAKKAFPDSLEASMLEADLLIAKEEIPDAEKLLQSLKVKFPKRLAPWLGLSSLASRAGRMDEALSLLDQAPSDPAGKLSLRIARINYWTKRGGADAGKELDKLGENLETLSATEQSILTEALTRANITLGRLDQADQLIKRLTTKDPDSIRYRNLQLEVAGRRDSDPAVVDAIKEIRRIEGDRGVIWRVAEARLLLARAKKGDQERIDAARRLMTEVAEIRPDQMELPGLRAEADELELGGTSQAISELQTAIKQGNRQPRFIQRLVQLLVAENRHAEADRLLRELETQGALDPSVKKVAAELALRQGDRVRAAKQARGAVPGTSRDPQNLVWRGRILMVSDQSEAGLAEAEANFKQAIEVAPAVLDNWFVLMDLLMAKRRTKDAVALYEKGLTSFKDDDKLYFEARGNQILRRIEKAKAAYEAWLAKRPEDPSALRRAAGFYQEIELLPTAEKLWRKLIDLGTKLPANELAAARLALANVLGKSANPADLEEALALIEKNIESRPAADAVAENKLKIDLLSRRPDRRKDAIKLYEELRDKNEKFAPQDRVRLAFLYQAEKQFDKAQEEMRSVVMQRDVSPTTISTYIQMLLAENTTKTLDEAERWMGDLTRKQGQSIATVELRARLSIAEGKRDEAKAALGKYLKANPKSTELMALLYDRLDFKEEAEQLLKTLAADAANPKAILAYARFLGRQKRHKEALDLCEKAAKTLPPEEVCTSVLIVVDNAKTDQATNTRAAKLIGSILETDAAHQSSNIPVMLAVVKTRQGLFDEVEASYREILKVRPDDMAVLNNMAWMLTMRGRASEALPMIERVIAAFGPSAKFLDTRGIVEMNLGRYPEAIKDFQDAITGRPDDIAAVYFHLAQAQHLSKDDVEARNSLELGQKLGLNADFLEPLEQPLYQELVKAIQPPK